MNYGALSLEKQTLFMCLKESGGVEFVPRFLMPIQGWEEMTIFLSAPSHLLIYSANLNIRKIKLFPLSQVH